MPKRTRSAPRDPFDRLSGPVSETLDLHGFRAVEARAHVADWIRAAARRNPGGLLHVITGRGLGSKGRPVLGGVVRRVLREETFARVVEWGPDASGGGILIRVK